MNDELQKGDIVQITDTNNKWYPCLLVVDEVKAWGIQAYVSIPIEKGVGDAYYRIENGKFNKVGRAIIVSP